MDVHCCVSCGTLIPDYMLASGRALRTGPDQFHCINCVNAGLSKLSESKIRAALFQAGDRPGIDELPSPEDAEPQGGISPLDATMGDRKTPPSGASRPRAATSGLNRATGSASGLHRPMGSNSGLHRPTGSNSGLHRPLGTASGIQRIAGSGIHKVPAATSGLHKSPAAKSGFNKKATSGIIPRATSGIHGAVGRNPSGLHATVGRGGSGLYGTVGRNGSGLRPAVGSNSRLKRVEDEQTKTWIIVGVSAVVVIGAIAIMLLANSGGKTESPKTPTVADAPPAFTSPSHSSSPSSAPAHNSTPSPSPAPRPVAQVSPPVSRPAPSGGTLNPVQGPAKTEAPTLPLPLFERQDKDDTRESLGAVRLSAARQFHDDNPNDIAAYRAKLLEIQSRYRSTKAAEEAGNLLAALGSATPGAGDVPPPALRPPESQDWLTVWEVLNLEKHAKAQMFDVVDGRQNVLETYPPDETKPLLLKRSMRVLAGQPYLELAVRATAKGSYQFSVNVNGMKTVQTIVGGADWRTFFLDLSSVANKDAAITLVHYDNGPDPANAYWLAPRLVSKPADGAMAISWTDAPTAAKAASPAPPVIATGDIKLEYERMLTETLELVQNKQLSEALSHVEKAQANAAFAPIHRRLELDKQCLQDLDLRAAILDGAKKCTGKTTITLSRTDGKDIHIGGEGGSTISKVDTDSITLNYNLDGVTAETRLKIHNLTPQTQWNLAVLGLPDTAQSHIKLALWQIAHLKPDDAAALSEIQKQLDLARVDASLSKKTSHVEMWLEFIQGNYQARQSYKQIDDLIRSQDWQKARTAIANFKKTWMNSYALAKVQADIDRWEALVASPLLAPAPGAPATPGAKPPAPGAPPAAAPGAMPKP